MAFRPLFIGDIVGEAGCTLARTLVPGLRRELGLHAVVANGENSAPSGRGITVQSGEGLLSVANFLTLGNHAFDAEGGRFLDLEPRAVRSANLEKGSPGSGPTFEANGVKVGVANVLGRVFMRENPRSPFSVAEKAAEGLREAGAELVLVDVHAEATSEKEAMGYHLDGKAQVVVGTHTHVPTAGARILPGGTAYVTDVGMTGPSESIIGFDKEDLLGLFLARGPGRVTLMGV